MKKVPRSREEKEVVPLRRGRQRLPLIPDQRASLALWIPLAESVDGTAAFCYNYIAMNMEMYRSGRNENDSKSFCLEIGTWVRIPPSPPRRNGLRSIQKARSLTGLFSYTPSFLLFRKRSRLLRLLACKRAPNASAALPTFCEWVRGCRIPPSLIIKDP